MTRWFEDIRAGDNFELGAHTFSLEEVVRFAKAYDPQYFHTDIANAQHSHFGGIVASGWHTVSVGHRKMVDALDAESARLRDLGQEPGVSGPSPGVNSMVFKAPVRPGDTVSYRLTITGKRPSNSIPGWGLLFNTIEAHNQSGALVYRAEVVGFSKLRDYRPGWGTRVAQALAKVPGVLALLRRSA